MNTIITLNWNTTELLIGLFESIQKNTSSFFELIIVDNGSVDQEFDKLKKYFDDAHDKYSKGKHRISSLTNKIYQYYNEEQHVVIKRLSKNLGFAAGNNIGISLIKETSNSNDLPVNIVFINSDIVIEENNWCDKFEQVFKDKDVGVVGASYHPLRWTRDCRFELQPIPNQPIESESVQGAFFSIPYEILKQVKEKDGCWFDENFKFAHYEETDLCFRIMDLGYKCFWTPCKHLHLHNKSSTKKNGYKLSDEIQNINDFKANSERNRLLLSSKHKTRFESK